MGRDAIVVRKPAWIRMVNPEPIRILDMVWRYGSHVMIEPGGVFLPIAGDKTRVLAMYQPMNPPTCGYNAPPDALALYTPMDFRLLADGHASYGEPADEDVPEYAPDMRATSVLVGDRAGVPCSRLVWAHAPGGVRHRRLSEPYRDRIWTGSTYGPGAYRRIRPGGTMTVFTHDGEEPGMLLTVRYGANPEYNGAQCENGSWFHIPEQEFLRMKREAERLVELEARERSDVIKLMQAVA